MAEVSRRLFLGGVAAIAVVSAIGSAGKSSAQTTRSSAMTRLNQFAYGEVKLTGGPLKEQFDRTLKYYLGLDEDRVLKVYRQNAGLPAPGADMGGWYDPQGFG